jgi:hypothetical protein
LYNYPPYFRKSLDQPLCKTLLVEDAPEFVIDAIVVSSIVSIASLAYDQIQRPHMWMLGLFRLWFLRRLRGRSNDGHGGVGGGKMTSWRRFCFVRLTVAASMHTVNLVMAESEQKLE